MLTMIMPNTNNLINFIIDEEYCYITTNKIETDHSLKYMLEEVEHAINDRINITPQKSNFFNKLMSHNIFGHQQSANYNSNNLQDILYHLKKDLLDNDQVEFDQDKDRIAISNSLFYQVDDASDKDSEAIMRYDLLGIKNLELSMNIADSGLLNLKNYEIRASVNEIGNDSGSYYGAFFYIGRSTYSLIPKNIYDILTFIKEHKSQLLNTKEQSPECINNQYVAKIKKIIAYDQAIHIDQLSQFNLDFICFDDDENNILELQKYLSDHGNIKIEPKFRGYDIEFNKQLLKKIRDFNGKSPYYKLSINGKETIVTFNHKICDLLEKICDNPTISKEYLAQLINNPNELELFKNTGELIHVSEFADNIVGFTIQDDMNLDSSQSGYKNNCSYPVELEFTDLNDNTVKQDINSADEMRALKTTIKKHHAQEDPYFTIDTKQGIVACPFSEPNLNTLEREGVLQITLDNNDENSLSKDCAVIELHNIYNDTIQLLKSYQKRVVKDIYDKIVSNSILDISQIPYSINIEYLVISPDNIKGDYNSIYLNPNNLLNIARGLRIGFQFSNEEQFDLTQFKQNQLEKLNLETLFAQPHLPNTLKSTLKNHQKYGISWLQRCYSLKEQNYQYQGVLLADDMGLGKTIQVLTFIEYLITIKKILKPILIVSPLSLFDNWVKEYMQHFRYEQAELDQEICVLHGRELKTMKHAYASGREYMLNNIYSGDTGIATLNTGKIKSYKIIITNYETVANFKTSLCSIDFGLVVLDEAQNIKSRNAYKTQMIKSLKADFRIAMTGTPVENSLLDLFSILEFLKIKVVDGEAKEFKKQFCDQNNQEQSLKELKRRLFYDPNQPLPYAYLLRRLKDGNIDDLPTKTIHKPYEVLYSDDQYQDYKHLREQMRSRAKNTLAILEDINLLHQAYTCQKNRHECESILLKTFALDNKAKKLIEILENIIERSDDKILIFVRYKKVQRLIQLLIHDTLDMESSIINSENKKNNNIKINEWKKEDNKNKVLILSPKVAGVGLNLTEANHVVHYGRWWNPAVESQATDRVYRIGQKKPVHVYYINYVDKSNNPIPSFDERLTELLQSKVNYAKDFLHPYDNEEQLSEELIKQILQ